MTRRSALKLKSADCHIHVVSGRKLGMVSEAYHCGVVDRCSAEAGAVVELCRTGGGARSLGDAMRQRPHMRSCSRTWPSCLELHDPRSVQVSLSTRRLNTTLLSTVTWPSAYDSHSSSCPTKRYYKQARPRLGTIHFRARFHDGREASRVPTVHVHGLGQRFIAGRNNRFETFRRRQPAACGLHSGGRVFDR